MTADHLEEDSCREDQEVIGSCHFSSYLGSSYFEVILGVNELAGTNHRNHSFLHVDGNKRSHVDAWIF